MKLNKNNNKAEMDIVGEFEAQQRAVWLPSFLLLRVNWDSSFVFRLSSFVFTLHFPVSFRSARSLAPIGLMAVAWPQLISIVFLILYLAPWVVPLSADSNNVLLSPTHHEASPRAMILPLHHSDPDSSVSDFNPRRQLQGSQSRHHLNARMGLHDDLLRNGFVSFTPLLPLRPFLLLFYFFENNFSLSF